MAKKIFGKERVRGKPKVMRELVEGMARCIFNDKMEIDLAVGEVCYVREIPNMPGHCVVLRNKKNPLVGHHLDRFKLLEEYEV